MGYGGYSNECPECRRKFEADRYKCEDCGKYEVCSYYRCHYCLHCRECKENHG